MKDANETVMAGQPLHAAGEPISGFAATGGRVEWESTADIFAPLPPVKWVVQQLQIGPGRPAMFVGLGASGKTLVLQSVVLSVAAGKPIWNGVANWSSGKLVKHLDYEQGRHATRRRYQRLALGMGIHQEALGNRLRVATFPSIHLNDEDAVSAYVDACGDAELVILDALRGATPGEDENDSKIRACIDNLTRVSEKTGTAFVVIHHGGKAERADGRLALRGSSAIFDGCGAVFVMSGSKGEAKRVSHWKPALESDGEYLPDFSLAIEDVAVGAEPKAGVRVVYALGVANDDESRFDQDRAKIVKIVKASPGISKRTLRTLEGIQAKRTDDIVADLLDTGSLMREPNGAGHAYYVPAGLA